MRKILLVIAVLALVSAIPGVGYCQGRVQTYDQQYVEYQYQVIPRVYNVRTTVTQQTTVRQYPPTPISNRCQQQIPIPQYQQYPQTYPFYNQAPIMRRGQAVRVVNRPVDPQYYYNRYLTDQAGCYADGYYDGGCPLLNLCKVPFEILGAIFGGDDCGIYSGCYYR